MLRGRSLPQFKASSGGRGGGRKKRASTPRKEQPTDEAQPKRRGGGRTKRDKSQEELAREAAKAQEMFDACDIGVDKNRPLMDCIRAGEELVGRLNVENTKIEKRVFGAQASMISQKEYEALQNEQRRLGEKLRILNKQLRILSMRSQHTFHEYARAQLEAAFDPSIQTIAGGSFGNGCTDF